MLISVSGLTRFELNLAAADMLVVWCLGYPTLSDEKIAKAQTCMCTFHHTDSKDPDTCFFDAWVPPTVAPSLQCI